VRLSSKPTARTPTRVVSPNTTIPRRTRRPPLRSPLHTRTPPFHDAYAPNFYITNAAVLVPTFNDPHDRVALGILGELIRDRPVVGIHAVDLVWGLGTLHCLTQQQPKG
jgi:agmatine deiminase